MKAYQLAMYEYSSPGPACVHAVRSDARTRISTMDSILSEVTAGECVVRTSFRAYADYDEEELCNRLGNEER